MRLRRWVSTVILGFAAGLLNSAPTAAQDAPAPTLRVGVLPGSVKIDGLLDEPAWSAAESIDSFTQTDPMEGAPASARTEFECSRTPRRS
ncbi:MAG: hypothetical protein H0W53_16505 [Acidobacteria bacterium]|nr:hypothetical protein [Acidobacteriota bacterium]